MNHAVWPGAAAPSRAADSTLQGVATWCTLALGLCFIVLPVGALLIESVFNADGSFAGPTHLISYFQTPALLDSAWRSVRLATISAAITTALAFAFAYGLTSTCMPAKGVFRGIALVPLLAPSLLMAISLVYLFGNQGLLKGLLPWIGVDSLYGEFGIVLGSILWTFPHALLVLSTALATTDGRLYEAAETLGASRWRVFCSVTLPASRYGLLMALVVVFVLVITDFGVPKVVGGQASVLATDIYKQVVGQQNFQMGAVVGLILLLPAALAFVVEGRVRARQSAALGVRSTPYNPKPHAPTDWAFAAFCAVVAFALLAAIGVAVFASVATYWPYNLSLTLAHYDFNNMDGGGWASYFNSLILATATAVIGAAASFVSAYLVDKPRHHVQARQALNLIATLPLAVPGLVLGLGYILFFNAPGNPMGGLYGTMAILVLCTVAHFFSVAHLTQLTALRQLDREYEVVGESLGVPFWRTALQVHGPVCMVTVLEVSGYFFVNAMTTVSAVVFLYAPSTQLASVAVLNMDDAGDIAPAAAMAVLIFVTAAVVRLGFAGASRSLVARTQVWRHR